MLRRHVKTSHPGHKMTHFLRDLEEEWNYVPPKVEENSSDESDVMIIESTVTVDFPDETEGADRTDQMPTADEIPTTSASELEVLVTAAATATVPTVSPKSSSPTPGPSRVSTAGNPFERKPTRPTILTGKSRKDAERRVAPFLSVPSRPPAHLIAAGVHVRKADEPRNLDRPSNEDLWSMITELDDQGAGQVAYHAQAVHHLTTTETAVVRKRIEIMLFARKRMMQDLQRNLDQQIQAEENRN